MDDFLSDFKKILSAAMEWGAKSVPLGDTAHPSPFRDEDHRKKFMSACHRGYEKAQSRLVELVKEYRSSKTLSDDDKKYRELCLRRIFDTIAFVILRTQSHVARRLVLHDRPSFIDIKLIEQAKEEAIRLNNESRMTFSLIADLSTFIHVCDILRIDFRPNSPQLSLIELKTGKVNQLLLEKLSEYDAKPESIDLLEKDKNIREEHLPQAKRILKQKIRLDQIDKVIATDEGVDTVTGKPLSLVGDSFDTTNYDEMLDNLCDEAVIKKVASGTVQYCIHVGVAYSEDFKEARALSKKAALYAYLADQDKNNGRLKDIRQELSKLIDEKEFIMAFDNFNLNLIGMSDKPFPLWKIKRDHIFSFVGKKMSICTIFDLPGFIYLGSKMDLTIKLSSRKDAEKSAKDIGRRTFPRWGGRSLIVETPTTELTIGGGMIHRFISDLTTPAQFFKIWKNLKGNEIKKEITI